MRHIDERFISDLVSGKLSYFFNQVKNNRDTLSLEIRNGYVNIYYKGGSLLRITQMKQGGKYALKFDAKYCKNKNDDRNYDLLASLDKYDITAFEKYFELMKSEMDSWFDNNQRPERDYQHELLVNNPEIIDIEYQYKTEMRFDMLYFHDGILYVIENKYGNGAIGGKSGMSEHYFDICKRLEDPTTREEMIKSVCLISQNKAALGLNSRVIRESDIKGVEILFLMANYVEKGKKLAIELAKIKGSVPAKILKTSDTQVKIDLSQAEVIF